MVEDTVEQQDKGTIRGSDAVVPKKKRLTAILITDLEAGKFFFCFISS